MSESQSRTHVRGFPQSRKDRAFSPWNAGDPAGAVFALPTTALSSRNTNGSDVELGSRSFLLNTQRSLPVFVPNATLTKFSGRYAVPTVSCGATSDVRRSFSRSVERTCEAQRHDSRARATVSVYGQMN